MSVRVLFELEDKVMASSELSFAVILFRLLLFELESSRMAWVLAFVVILSKLLFELEDK